jgi:hypothetical protein
MEPVCGQRLDWKRIMCEWDDLYILQRVVLSMLVAAL